MATLALLRKSYVKGTEDLQNFSIVLCIFFYSFMQHLPAWYSLEPLGYFCHEKKI